MATDNERMFREKLSILNENFLRFLQKAHRSNSSLDFTPSIKDYLKHLRGLDQMYYVDETTDAPAVTNATLTAATTTAASIPLLFGTSATPKTTMTPTTAVFPSFSTLSEGVPLTSTSSSVTTTASTTETSAVPKPIVGATAPVTTTSPSSTLTFNGASTTTTTTAANIPLLFGITATPKTTTTTTAAFPSFSTFSAGNFPITSITGSLFGSSTTQTVTSTSNGQLQVNGGSRKRSAAQSVDEISPYGKRAASALTTETSVKCPFGTTASISTSASSAFTFGGASTTTTTTAANIPLLFGITTASKTTTTTTAAFPSFSTFSPGNFPTSSITGSLFGGSAINTATTTTISLTSTSSSVTTTASTTETSAVPKPIVGATVPVTTTNSSSTFSFGGFGATAPVTTTSPSSTFTFGGFGATAPVTTTTTSASSTFSFGGSPTTITTTAANIPLLFKSTATTAAFPSFSTFGAGIFPTSSITGSLFGGSATNTTNSSLVGSTEKEAHEKGNGSDGEPTEEFVPTDNFKPIVPLPPKVETKSGEENEEMLFSARCKLFRYKDKQSKERGIGELKLLHSKESGRYRCVIRSGDQLSKLFANFPVLANMKSQATQQKPNIRTLKCKDFSDNSDGVDELFLLKFRDQTTAEEFAAKLEETVKKLEKSKGTD